MRRRTLLGGLAGSVAVGSGLPGTGIALPITSLDADLNGLAVEVSSAENREFSYTDKQSAYFYGRTHQDNNQDWFAGWNVATRRIFQDYQLYVNGKTLNRAEAKVVVAPHQMVRTFAGVTETVSLLDDVEALVLGVDTDQKQDAISISLTGAFSGIPNLVGAGMLLQPVEMPSGVMLVAPLEPQALSMTASGRLSTRGLSGGFLILLGRTTSDVIEKLAQVRAVLRQKLAARQERMTGLIAGKNSLQSSDRKLEKALKWLRLTADQLVMKQQGTGIYAGLPWFNDYWGRDTFIAFKGALLVTGQFKAAKEVLHTFATLQNRDLQSADYGRVPNRARPNEVIYNTADGTPRFVISILDYIKYSGDLRAAAEFWPAIVCATDGALKTSTDSDGYLVHADADTWMDAKERGTRPFSPRGNRANDIQVLWHAQLLAAAQMASLISKNQDAARWRAVASKLKSSFEQDFPLAMDSGQTALADHLNAEGSPDRQIRPNQLFALDFLASERSRWTIIQEVWAKLVYPWGVASLSQDDPDFYPYHENWHYYHKDAAYHNGTVWLWLNGIAMQRALEFDQIAPAFALFSAMNQQALEQGAVGSLSELADALPRPDQTKAKLSGTFLQAWSNAEQLRVWHECFVGLQPDLLTRQIGFRPRLPTSIQTLSHSQIFGTDQSTLKVSWEALASESRLGRWTITWSGDAIDLVTEIVGFGTVRQSLKSGERLVLDLSTDGLSWFVADLARPMETPRAGRVLRQGVLRDMQEGTELKFCQPNLNPALKSLSVYHDEPLVY